MGFPEYLQSNRPPKPLVGWLLRTFGIEPNHDEDPGLWFAVSVAASFTGWLKQDAGVIWLYSVNGVRRVTPGPWDIFTAIEGQRRTSLNSNIVFAWDRIKPVRASGPISAAAEAIRSTLRTFKVNVPMEVIEYLRLPSTTTQKEFQAKVALVSSQVAGSWFATEAGHLWAFETQSILQVIDATQHRVYSERLVAIGPPRVVEHTRKNATDICEECNTSQPCIKQERDGKMCRRCAGYSSNSWSNDGHSICSKCDIVDCPHWKDFFTGDERQEWLLTVR